VKGLVGASQQKRTLVDAIASMNAGGSIATDLRTFAEAAARQSRTSAAATGVPTRVEFRPIPSGTAPIEAYLRAHVPDATLKRVVDDLTPRVLTAAGDLRRHTYALDAALDRFPEDRIAGLDAPGRAAWRALMTRHAQGCVDALDSLDRALAPYFSVVGDPIETSRTLSSAVHSAARDAMTIDEAITSAFTAGDPADQRQPQIGTDLRDHVQRVRFDVAVIQRLVGP
jgi:hypothetical protein